MKMFGSKGAALPDPVRSALALARGEQAITWAPTSEEI